MAGRSAQCYERRPIFSIFSPLGPFPQVFGQVKEWFILELLETIRVLHAVTCPIAFILFYKGSWNGRVFKKMFNLVFEVVWVH